MCELLLLPCRSIAWTSKQHPQASSERYFWNKAWENVKIFSIKWVLMQRSPAWTLWQSEERSKLVALMHKPSKARANFVILGKTENWGKNKEPSSCDTRERTGRNWKRDGVAWWSHARDGSVFSEKHKARFGAEKKDSGECDRNSLGAKWINFSLRNVKWTAILPHVPPM